MLLLFHAPSLECSAPGWAMTAHTKALNNPQDSSGMMWLVRKFILIAFNSTYHINSTRSCALIKTLLCVFVSPHHLRMLLVCVLRCEVLQDLLVVTAVDVVAIDLKDDLPGLKARPHRLPACSVSTRDQRSKCGFKAELCTTQWAILKRWTHGKVRNK